MLGDWKVEGDKLYKGQNLMNNNNEFVDMIKQNTNNEVTIFLNDTRISTTIVDGGKTNNWNQGISGNYR